jgi:hypothetical protein
VLRNLTFAAADQRDNRKRKRKRKLIFDKNLERAIRDNSTTVFTW